jgi:hypothetical protein
MHWISQLTQQWKFLRKVLRNFENKIAVKTVPGHNKLKASMMMANSNNIRRLFIFYWVIIFSCTSQPAKKEAAMETIDNNTAYELSKVFPVTPEKLFNAFLSETTLQKIWGVSSISIDARPEGKARAKLQIENENWDFTITYKVTGAFPFSAVEIAR